MPMSIPTLVTRWLYGHGKHESVVTPDFYNDRIVTFRDLIQVLAIKDFRRQYKIP